MNTILGRLSTWYLAHCDGDWEHQSGIIISTVDNPGWRIKINLESTDLESKPFQSYQDHYEHKTLWLKCWKDESVFHAACGPERLEDVLSVFLEWTDT